MGSGFQADAAQDHAGHGLHGPLVFKHLYTEALNRGDLEELF